MSNYAQPKWYYQLVENFQGSLQTENKLCPPYFLGEIAKLCKLVMGTLGMPGYAHSKW